MMMVPSRDPALVRVALPSLRESLEEKGQLHASRARFPAQPKRPWFPDHFVADGGWLPWPCSRVGSRQGASA
jgi:hypothetical protein